ncbi:hypothetical protein CC79DRAFT_101707 [Sarocladium strictum]
MAPILRYFVVRPAVEVTLPSGEVDRRPDTIVPLIPMDMIPEGVEIKGIPRQMTLAETMGMTHVGTTSLESDNGGKALALHQQQTGSSTSTAPTGLCYRPAIAEQPMGHEPKTEASQPSLRNVPPPLALPLTPEGTPMSQRAVPIKPSEHADTPVRQSRQMTTSNRSQTPSDKSEEPLHCQQWCHHGRCDRGGSCRSKHVMPQSLEGLKKVGLERLPLWYCQRKNHRQQPFRGVKDRWGPRHNAGRSIESSPGASTWTPVRYEGRSHGHAEKARADNERMMAFMNRDNPAVQKEAESEERRRTPTAAELRSSRESHDLLDLDISEPISRPGADRSAD